MPIRDYQNTPGANQQISGIDVRENVMVIQAANDVVRQMMADVKELQHRTSVPAASTMAIGAANAESIDVVAGTSTTINGFDNIAAGPLRELALQVDVTFKHNPAVLILAGADIAGKVGDVYTFRSRGAGVWALVGVQKVDGTALTITPVATPAQMRAATADTVVVTPKALSNIVGGPWLDVTSATTLDVAAAERANLRLLGSATIESLGNDASYNGVQRLLRAAAAPTFKNSGTLITGTGSDVVLAAGDTVEAVCLGGTPSVWMLRNLQRASAGSGTVLRILTAQLTDRKAFTVAHAPMAAFAPPSITDGNEIPELTLALSLAQATNKVRVQAEVVLASATALTHFLAVFRNGVFLKGSRLYSGGAEETRVTIDFVDTPGVVGPHTYTFRVANNTGSAHYVNGTHSSTTPYFGATGSASTSTLTEIAA